MRLRTVLPRTVWTIAMVSAENTIDIDYSKLEILIQPTSYVHSIVKFYGGTIHYLSHNPSMEIPIFNSIYQIIILKIIKLTTKITIVLIFKF